MVSVWGGVVWGGVVIVVFGGVVWGFVLCEVVGYGVVMVLWWCGVVVRPYARTLTFKFARQPPL